MRINSSYLYRSVVVLAILGAVADTVLFAVALLHLATGPSNFAYELLNVAVHGSIIETVMVAVASVAAALLRQGPAIFHGFVMLLASGFTGGIALGLFWTGSGLAGIDSTRQPARLSSMIYAIWGVGSQLWPIPVILTVTAGIVWVSPSLRSTWSRRGQQATLQTAS
ncbi:hypothetical protein AS850_03575 [Frondihabitans sp. 762G35]|uniref:hypothetical protein n=1 Tax=Frondihabitans sp. 762G35 TaxID=1446794 RepID=UPI000D224AD0|nr:hypothetical protein [Frondihabitans sp. 762G35]ARC56155.1 hypothetical protein AS850_03575 [Frondihabitans sp. 762G35]